MAFESGPYLELVTEPKKPIGFMRCVCGRVNEVRVNKTGWPYSYCYGEGGCEAKEVPGGKFQSSLLIARIHKFLPHKRRKALVMAGLRQPPKSRETSPEISDEVIEGERVDHVQLPASVPEPVQPQTTSVPDAEPELSEPDVTREPEKVEKPKRKKPRKFTIKIG